MKKILLICLALSPLTSCADSGKKALQEQVQTLQRENTALTAERDALKAQLGLTTAQVAANTTQTRDQSIKDAAASYARRCATGLEVIRIDSSDLAIPGEIDGKSCADGALGENAQAVTYGIASSNIRLDGDKYTIEVVDTTGQTTTQTSP